MGLQVGSLPSRMEVLHAGKKGRILILDHFYIILNLEVGRKSVSLPIFIGLWARRRIWQD
jgi:hypothetical protein